MFTSLALVSPGCQQTGFPSFLVSSDRTLIVIGERLVESWTSLKDGASVSCFLFPAWW